MTHDATRGVLAQVPEADYFADRLHLSHSAIELFLRDPRDYRDVFVLGKPWPAVGVEANLGSYIHALMLDFEAATEHFVVEPRPPTKGQWADDPRSFGYRPSKTSDPNAPVDRGIKSWKAYLQRWHAEQRAAGRTVVLPALADIAPVMVDALAAHDEAAQLMRAPGLREQAGYWVDRETGRPMRFRLDKYLLDERLIVELKTDQDIDPENARNQRRWHDWGYARKAAVYLDGMQEITGERHRLAFVFVENNERPRVAVRVVEPDRDLLVEIGRQEYRQAIRDIEAREKSGDWRQPWEVGIQPFPFPEWAERRFIAEHTADVTIGGELATAPQPIEEGSF